MRYKHPPDYAPGITLVPEAPAKRAQDVIERCNLDKVFNRLWESSHGLEPWEEIFKESKPQQVNLTPNVNYAYLRPI